MVHLIDKNSLVAEIEKLKACNRKICAGNFDFLKKSYPKHYYSTEIYNDILSFLDTLEVREVNLENDVDKILETNDWNFDKIDFYKFAKHFFELGLKAQKI